MPRPKGSPNKTTKEVKELLTNILSNHMDDLDACIEALPPARKVDALLKLAAMVLPRPHMEQIPFVETWEDEEPIVIQINDLQTPNHYPTQC
jgi:hypothetical protein